MSDSIRNAVDYQINGLDINNQDKIELKEWWKNKLIDLLSICQKTNDNEKITIEDHFNDGGFGSWVNECLLDTKHRVKIINKSIDYKVVNDVGSKSYLMKKFGLPLIL